MLQEIRTIDITEERLQIVVSSDQQSVWINNKDGICILRATRIPQLDLELSGSVTQMSSAK